MVTSPKCSLPPFAPLAACQTQLYQCAVKMWKNTGALCPRCPCAPQPAVSKDSSPQSLFTKTVSKYSCQLFGVLSLLPPQTLCQAQSLCKTPESHPLSKPVALNVPALPVPSGSLVGGHVQTCLALPMHPSSCSSFTQPPKGGSLRRTASKFLCSQGTQLPGKGANSSLWLCVQL